MNAKKSYNIAIDYWKFFFAVVVMEYHRTLNYGGKLGGGGGISQLISFL